LSLAEGLAPFAGQVAYIYRTEGGAGGKNEIPIQLKSILDRKSPDVPILANDVLYVTDRSGSRSLAACAMAVRAGITVPGHLEGGLLAWAAEVDPTLAVAAAG